MQLGNIGRWKAGGTPSRSNKDYYNNGTIPWLKTGDLTDGLIKRVEEYITDEALKNSSAHINPKGSVLIAMYGATIGKLGLLEFPCATNQACCACDVNTLICDRWYLFYFLESQRKEFIAKGAGGAQPNISRTKIVNHLIPLPPIEEQKRIVARIQILRPLIELYKQEEKQLEVIESSFPKKLRASILQEAIQGKLVPQLESEPEVEQIGEAPEDVPFAIPEKWKWVLFSDAVKVISSRPFQIKAKEVLEQGLYPVISQSKEQIDGYSNDDKKLIPDSELPIIIFGDHTRTLKYVDFRFVVGADGTKLLHVKTSSIDPKYFYIALQSMIGQTRQRGYSRHFQFLKVLHIPIPPIEEQRRIVAKLNELLDSTSQLERTISTP